MNVQPRGGDLAVLLVCPFGGASRCCMDPVGASPTRATVVLVQPELDNRPVGNKKVCSSAR